MKIVLSMILVLFFSEVVLAQNAKKDICVNEQGKTSLVSDSNTISVDKMPGFQGGKIQLGGKIKSYPLLPTKNKIDNENMVTDGYNLALCMEGYRLNGVAFEGKPDKRFKLKVDGLEQEPKPGENASPCWSVNEMYSYLKTIKYVEDECRKQGKQNDISTIIKITETSSARCDAPKQFYSGYNVRLSKINCPHFPLEMFTTFTGKRDLSMCQIVIGAGANSGNYYVVKAEYDDESVEFIGMQTEKKYASDDEIYKLLGRSAHADKKRVSKSIVLAPQSGQTDEKLRQEYAAFTQKACQNWVGESASKPGNDGIIGGKYPSNTGKR